MKGQRATHKTQETHTDFSIRTLEFRRQQENQHRKTACNLCGKHFHAQSSYERFCHECKMGNEVYLGDEEMWGQA